MKGPGDLGDWTVKSHPDGGLVATSPGGLTVRGKTREQLVTARQRLYSEELTALREEIAKPIRF